MNLKEFKMLVDAAIPRSPSPEINNKNFSPPPPIRACFTEQESDQARSDIGHIIDDLGLRYMCEQDTPDPYLGVAEIIIQELRERGTSTEATSNWALAIELAAIHSTTAIRLPSKQAWTSNTRVNYLSTAICELRKLGYNIELPKDGGVSISDLEIQKLAQDIDRKAASLGNALAASASGAMEQMYSPFTGRFHIGRSGQTVEVNAKPSRPFAYLYQLGLRYSAQHPTAPFPSATYIQLVDLATWATALLDISVGTFELMFARSSDMVRIMKKSIMYDSVFLLAQAKPSHAREYLEWMMSHKMLSGLRDKRGRTSAQILSTATTLLRLCENAIQHDFTLVPVQNIAYATNLDFQPAEDILHEVFTHTKGANQTLTFPPDDKAIDAAFRPLLIINGFFAMQPAPMAARATVNAALQWCRENWAKSNFDEKILGPLFEDFVRQKLNQHGVSVIGPEL
ncbi:hypothetical protein [Castellaniella defragrans]|uniref:hypothetical protein n=1 Tax=Castellaniella defragrans TaxID=75697 RepID=UPI002B001C11|nr:hypothetical protein [Castellaniella defragrans]